MKEGKPITRTVSSYKTKNKNMYRIHIPEEMGLKGGDVVLFEKVNDKEIKMIKLT